MASDKTKTLGWFNGWPELQQRQILRPVRVLRHVVGNRASDLDASPNTGAANGAVQGVRLKPADSARTSTLVHLVPYELVHLSETKQRPTLQRRLDHIRVAIHQHLDAWQCQNWKTASGQSHSRIYPQTRFHILHETPNVLRLELNAYRRFRINKKVEWAINIKGQSVVNRGSWSLYGEMWGTCLHWHNFRITQRCI